MVRIGVRELRQHASRYLRLVDAGETVEVTDRGRPVARIVPLRKDVVGRLISEGRLHPPSEEGDLLDDKPLAPKRGVPLPSRLISDGRAD